MPLRPLFQKAIRLSTLILALLMGASTQAATLYWNVGGTIPAGAWDLTTANWSTSTTGLPLPNITYVNTSDVVFSAGTAGTGTYSLTVNGTLKANSLNFEEGRVTLASSSGGTVSTDIITLSGTNPSINVQNTDSTIAARFNTDTANPTLTKTGLGKIIFGYGANSVSAYYSISNGGTLQINAGTVEIAGTTGADQFTLGTVNIANSASFIYSATNSLSNNTIFNLSAGGSLIVNNVSDLINNIAGSGLILQRGGTLNLAATTTTSIFSGLLTGTGGIGLNNGNGAVILAGANTFTGTTSLTMGVTGSDTNGNPAGSTATGSIRLANVRALQNSTVLQRQTSGAGITFDSTNGSTFIIGGLTSITIVPTGSITQAIHNAMKAINLEDLSGNAIALQVGNNDGSTSYSGKLSGSGSMVKIGMGTLSVTGHYNTDTLLFTPLSYTGDTVVNRGAHNSGGSTLNSSQVGTLNLNFATDYAPAANVINPASGLVLGGGRLLITSKNSFAANQTFARTQLNAGRSYIETTLGATASTANLQLGTITRSTGAVLDFILPTGTTVGTSASTANINGILGPWAFVGTTFAMKDASNNIVAYDKVANYSTQLGGTITSSATTNLEITADTSAITVAGGATTSLNTLQISDTVNLRTVTIGTNGILSTNAIWRNNNANINQYTITGGKLTAGADTGTNAELVLHSGDNSGGVLRIESVISDNAGGGAVTLVKTGLGQIHLIASNDYSGGTYILHGRVNVTTATSLGTGTVTVAPGGQAFIGASGVNNNFVIAGTGWGESAGPGAIRMNGGTLGSAGKTIALAGDARIGTNGGTVILASKITGDYGLDISAAGTQGTFTLTNTGNDFAGNLTLNTVIGSNSGFSGTLTTLKLGASGVIPDGVGKGNVILTGGAGAVTLDLNGFNETINALNSQGTSTNVFITNTGAAAATLTLGNNEATSVFTPNTTTSAISNGFAGILRDGTSKLALTKIGLGAQTLAGANTYSGDTTVSAGILKAGAANTFSPNSAVIVGSGSSTILDLADFDQTIASLSGNGYVNLGTTTGGILTTGNTTNTAYAGDIVGAGGLAKLGTGAFTISGQNSYLGATNVNAGTLQVGVAGTGQTGAGTVTISNTGTLAGTGMVRGAATVASGGILRPGDSAGTGVGKLSFSDTGAASLTLATGSNTYLTLAGATGTEANPMDGIQAPGLLSGTVGNHDQLTVQGGVVLNANGKINVSLSSGYTPAWGDVYNLIDWGFVAGTSLTQNGFDVNTDLILELNTVMTAGGLSWSTDQFISSGIIYVVPEPSRCVLLALGIAAGALRRRRPVQTV